MADLYDLHVDDQLGYFEFNSVDVRRIMVSFVNFACVNAFWKYLNAV